MNIKLCSDINPNTAGVLDQRNNDSINRGGAITSFASHYLRHLFKFKILKFFGAPSLKLKKNFGDVVLMVRVIFYILEFHSNTACI